jgi:uncharacterized protein (UPF0371 family)
MLIDDLGEWNVAVRAVVIAGYDEQPATKPACAGSA